MPLIKTIPVYEIPAERELADWGTVDEARARELQERLDGIINRLGLLGLQVSLRDPGGQTWTGASGTADLKRKQQLTPDQFLRVGSVTKAFTAVVTLGLIEAGVLGLGDTLDGWFPDFPRGDLITLRMLLGHTSGIGHPPFTIKVKLRLLFSKRSFTLDELVDLAARTEPYDEPGGSHQYSNANYHLLGAIAERASGSPIEDLLDELVLNKLGLERTALLPQQTPPPGLAAGWDNLYTPSIRCLEVKPDNLMLPSHANTSGGMVSTARELRRFIDGLFAGDLLGAELLEQMTTIEECDAPEYHHTGHGLGLFRIAVGRREYLGHLGLFVGSGALVLHDPATTGSVAVVGNLSESRVFDVAEEFSDQLLP